MCGNTSIDYDPNQNKSLCQVLSQSSGTDSDTNNVCGAAIAGTCKLLTNLKKSFKEEAPYTACGASFERKRGKGEKGEGGECSKSQITQS